MPRDGAPTRPGAATPSDKDAAASLSVADTNALRASLGLPPLRAGPAPPDQAAQRRAAAARAASDAAAGAEADALAARVAA